MIFFNRSNQIKVPPGPLSSYTARALEWAVNFALSIVPKTDLHRSIPMTEGGTYSGNQLSLAALNVPFWAQLTSGSTAAGNYSWQEVIPTPTGWQNQSGFASGTDTAYEANGNNVLGAGLIVKLRRAYWNQTKNTWMYAFDHCCSAGCGSGSGSG